MFLGIEIGGTKLQLGVGDGRSGELVELVRADVEAEKGATGILRQIKQLGSRLIASHQIQGVGIGFGGPVDVSQGRVIKSHQICGWDNFHLSDWCRESFGRDVVLGNDCDCATLAEARFGAGQGRSSVLYVTVGTGVGGGFVHDGRLLGKGRPAASEIGHLRPGLRRRRARCHGRVAGQRLGDRRGRSGAGHAPGHPDVPERGPRGFGAGRGSVATPTGRCAAGGREGCGRSLGALRLQRRGYHRRAGGPSRRGRQPARPIRAQPAPARCWAGPLPRRSRCSPRKWS